MRKGDRCGDIEGFPSPDWSDAFGELPRLERPLRLQLLCGGIGAAERWLQQQGCAFVADPYVDSSSWLAPALQSLYGRDEHSSNVMFAVSRHVDPEVLTESTTFFVLEQVLSLTPLSCSSFHFDTHKCQGLRT